MPEVADAPLLSIVIVNYNTVDDLLACLTALQHSTQPAEIIVVDNASRDGSAARVAQQFPDVTLLAQDHNTWFCGGNTLGLRAARGSYALMLNPDTVVAPDALAKLVAFMGAHPDYAGCTAQLRYPDGSIQRTCSRIPSYAYLLFKHTPLLLITPVVRRLDAWHWYAEWDRASSRDVAVLPGSCLLMRREDLTLHDELWLYFPEDDLARRFAGRRFRYIAEAQITHKEKASTKSWLATRVYFRDLLIYTRAHHGAARSTLLWALSRPLLWAMWAKAQVRAKARA